MFKEHAAKVQIFVELQHGNHVFLHKNLEVWNKSTIFAPKIVEKWAKAVGLWIESVEESLSLSLGEQIADGGEAVV